jgi:shikimate kinase
MLNDSPAPLLVLIGFMGAGKSTVGRLLALQLACHFIDLDVEITHTHGPITDLFSTLGESGFRAIEHHHLALILPKLQRPSILALGGGAFHQSANRELLASHSATVIFLDAPFEVVRARIADSGHQRPLARDLDRLRNLYEQRRPTYLLAHHTFDASAANPSELLTSLVQLANRLGISGSAHAKLKQGTST